MSFAEIPLASANRLINHGPAVLVSASHDGQANLMTAAWSMPVSHTPPMAAVAIGPKRHTHDLIIASGAFAVNVPGAALLEAVWCCGTTSGRQGDKFAACGLTPVPGAKTGAPLVAECLGALECRLTAHVTAGDHTIMIGEVLAGWVKPEDFSGRWLVEKEAGQTLHHLGGKEFCLPGKIVKIGNG